MAADTRRRVAVLGAGLIGIDLVDRVHRSAKLDLVLVAGRGQNSLGLHRVAELGYPTAAGGIGSVVEAGPFDVVFDATNADSHAEHWAALRPTGATLIDLTPTGLGTVVVPGVSPHYPVASRHLNLVSCGGQAAIPVLHAVSRHCAPTYVEVVATGAAASAGRATRRNLDQYIDTTSAAIRAFTGTEDVKVMVNLSPARPAPPFRVAITALADGFSPAHIRTSIAAIADTVRGYAPGFEVTSLAMGSGRISVAVQVTTSGRRLPHHAGSVDIINAAAVLLAEQSAAAL
ncbi:acetaldehyde dehydrogenase (acetylating) [Streptomyces lichenis]|uniref:Acetaldehyde dehydrogenase n=1 Tax=Streptomyces lichenis TaxID=2306967 RepID=A0ABT0IEU1_9ACTN|nr:acetaldehyde dehydrogenase (acetylating) [Streptomyces lichenis]MCK8679841.1 acetaldehyde dehydrogenase (acetylating) [Streptomyces lichenis]